MRIRSQDEQSLGISSGRLKPVFGKTKVYKALRSIIPRPAPQLHGDLLETMVVRGLKVTDTDLEKPWAQGLHL